MSHVERLFQIARWLCCGMLAAGCVHAAPRANEQGVAPAPIKLEGGSCVPVALGGLPDVTCIEGEFGDNTLYLKLARRDGQRTPIELSSWYWDSRVSPLHWSAQQGNALSVTTTGVHGSGIRQRLWILLGGDKGECKPLLLESLDAYLWQMGGSEHFLHVMPRLIAGKTPRVLIDYRLDHVTEAHPKPVAINQWRDLLIWDKQLQHFVLAARSGNPYLAAVTAIDATRIRLPDLTCHDFGVQGRAWAETPIMRVLDEQ